MNPDAEISANHSNQIKSNISQSFKPKPMLKKSPHTTRFPMERPRHRSESSAPNSRAQKVPPPSICWKARHVHQEDGTCRRARAGAGADEDDAAARALSGPAPSTVSACTSKADGTHTVPVENHADRLAKSCVCVQTRNRARRSFLECALSVEDESVLAVSRPPRSSSWDIWLSSDL